ncbi:recombinase family protein [Streptosporangium roseum]|uniref:recombinase family protein n=1 Tax=Streptosporangium roseum TaxID=2001 RepID=UPI00332A8115
MSVTDGTRALIVIRLSNMTDTTTSPQRQREICEKYCTTNALTIVGHAEDLDVSATEYAPWDRPELGEWMRDRAAQFDVMVFCRADRLVRNAGDLTQMAEWARKHGKRLISATEPNFDVITAAGEGIATIQAVFARMESEATRARVMSAKDARRKAGEWNGSSAPYGYSPVPADDGGFRLEPDENSKRILEWADAVIAGKSRVSIVEELRATKALTPADVNNMRAGRSPKGNVWTLQAVTKILTSRILIGETVHNGEVLRVEEALLGHLGDEEVKKAVHIPSEDHTSELADVAELMRKTREERRKGHYNYPGSEEDFENEINALVKQRKYLASLPHHEAKTEYLPTGENFRDFWRRLAPEEKGVYLREVEFKIYVTEMSKRLTDVHMVWGLTFKAMLETASKHS